MFGECMFGEMMLAGWGDDSVAANWEETGIIKTIADDTE